MATGKLPFQGNTSAVIFHAILSQAPISPRELNHKSRRSSMKLSASSGERPKLRHQSAATSVRIWVD